MHLKLWPLLCLLVKASSPVWADDILPVLQAPVPFPNVKMPYISPRDLEAAFAAGEDSAQKRTTFETNLAKYGGVIAKNSFSAEARHQRFTSADPQAIDMDRNQKIFEGASDYLIQKFNLSPDQIRYGLARVGLPGGSQTAGRTLQKCQKLFATNQCDSTSYFRTPDGSCNNLDNPLWGKSFTCFERLLPADYADVLDAPRVSKSGAELPNPRVISRFIHDDINIPARDYTLMTMQWGQFMDHDMTLTPMTRAGPNLDMIECCPLNNGQPKHPACFPIPIPNDDYFFTPQGQTCLNFVRSAACDGTCSLGQRQQTNQLTAFIDASNVYGSEKNNSDSLRTFRNGLMKTQTYSGADGPLLPPSEDPLNDQCSRQEGTLDCFHAGDERVNEQPGLTSMHTIWVRQHNRIAQRLKYLHPTATDEELYQNSRKIVGAQLQAITYGEFLPVILGPAYMKYYKLAPLSNGFTKYDPNTQPSIVHEFSTACYRFGHTLIDNILPQSRLSNGGYLKQYSFLNLSEHFFFPFPVFRGQLPSILTGLVGSPAQQYDRHIVKAVTNNLYKQRGTPFGMDLPALNLQRGRDHGLNGYIYYINYCFQIVIKNFSDLGRFMIKDNWVKLSQVYKSVEDIELFTGGVSETPLTGGVVGPTFGCVIGLQFYHLKFGDRFYFEHGGLANSFNSYQLADLRKTTLSRVLCYNGNIPVIQQNVFLPQEKVPLVDCDSLPELDMDSF